MCNVEGLPPTHPTCVPAELTRPWPPVQVSDSFPFKWINKKWKEGFYVTSMATSHTRWAVVMSRNAGYIDQVIDSPPLLRPLLGHPWSINT